MATEGSRGRRFGTWPRTSRTSRRIVTVFPPYAIRELGGVKIAFIGETLAATPTVSVPSSVKGLSFGNEVATVNALVPELKKADVSAIVLVLHQGGFQGKSGTYDSCEGFAGEIVPLLAGDPDAGRPGLSPAVDVVVSGHTHQAYDQVVDGRLVTSAASFGRLVTKIDLVVDPVDKRRDRQARQERDRDAGRAAGP